jgi:26S proteasome non-ATPase regulatory subunit 9
MTQSLVDLQGFPRNDVDVHQVLIARNAIIRLQNDFKQVTGDIEAELLKFHAVARQESGLADVAFAEVNTVASGSPADEAGLKKGDRIVKFGRVVHVNHRNLAAVGELVGASENVRECNFVEQCG